MTHGTGWCKVHLICGRDWRRICGKQTALDLFYRHLIDLKGRPAGGVPDAHMLFRCPIRQMELTLTRNFFAQLGQIHFVIWTDTFCNLDKYMLQF